jgi:tetratricopeptide (TPR) repeat protein
LLEEKPRDTKILHELGRLHLELGQSQQAVEVYDKLSHIDPTDAEALRLGKDAAARGSMTTGGWTQAESYRDVIKDKGIAVALEQQSRVGQTGQSLEQQIEETYARHQAEPQSVDLARRLGVLYEQNQDTENAIAWFQYAADLTNNMDASLVGKVSDLQRVRAEAEISAHEKFLANHGPDTPEYAARSEALALAKKQQAELSIDEARKRSERNPTDLQLRFQLGERLVEAGRPREALPELQRARQNPNARLKSMNLLGRCYRELGMLDLAAKQLEEAAKDITAMDAMKKEIVYNLGLVYEQMGEAEKSIAAMKQIYEADYGYRDVAARVERSYERK